MGIFRRSLLYLSRKKGKALLLFFLFFFLSILLLVGVSVLSGTHQAAKDLRSNIGAAFYIRPYEKWEYENGQLSSTGTPIMTQQAIRDVLAAAGGEVKAYNTEHYGYVKSEAIEFLAGAGHSAESNMGKVTAVRSSKLTDVFLNGEYTLLEGRHIDPDDENKILISRELAEENQLNVGDCILLTHAGLGQQGESYVDTIPEKRIFAEAEIVGIFQVENAQDIPESPTAGKTVNHIICDSHLLENLEEQQEGVYEGEIAFFIADPLHLDEMLEKVRAVSSVDWDNHILRENDFQYEKIAGQLKNIQTLTRVLIITASALSVILLMLILMMRLRARVHEAGILLSVGKSRAEIVGQFILETAIVMSFSFLFAFLASVLTARFWNQQLAGTFYLRIRPMYSAMIFGGELAVTILVILISSGAVLRLKPGEILNKMS